jgi:hypothetical protein
VNSATWRRVVVERVGVDLEQLVARIGFQDRQQRLAVMAVGIQPGAAHDAIDARAQQRHVLRHRVIGSRGEEADQPVLAGDPAVAVMRLGDHAIHRAAAMDQRAAIGLHDQQLVGAAGEARHRLAAAHALVEQPDLVAPQDAERGAGHDLVAQAARLGGVLDIAIAAVAEESEMVGLEPAQEFLVLGKIGGAAGRQILDRVEAGPPQRAPVLHGQADLGEHAGEGGSQFVEQRRIGLAVDLDQHQRFARRAFGHLARQFAEIAVEIAPHGHHGMGQQMDGDLAAIEFVGDRIDQERHVVVHDLHDRVAALEAVVGQPGIEQPDLGDARQAAAGKGQQRDGGGGALLGRGGGEVLVGDPFVQAAGKLGGVFPTGELQGGNANRVQAVGLGAAAAC